MDEFPIKLDRLISVMNDFIGKLHNFEKLITNETKSSGIRDILINVEELRSCLKNCTEPSDNKSKIFNDKVERLFSEFNWNVNYTIKPTDYVEFIVCCKTLVATIMKMLGKRNCGILVLEMYFQICMNLVNELSANVEENVNVLKDLPLFQSLVKGFLSSVRVLKKFWYIIVPSQKKCSVLLCLNQSFKTLAIMGKVLDKGLRHTGLNIYLLNRLKQCFNKVLELLLHSEEELSNNEFITLMDSCLSKLDRIGYEMTPLSSSDKDIKEFVMSLKPMIDELLCHAMTVAHISSRETVTDKIKLHSQQVLTELENMKNSEDDFVSGAVKLSDVLCKLEEVVNIAILNLVLDVFIDIHNPLRALVNKCNTSKEGSKSANDLENEISAFDEHLDRIMQIGLFAVSCSTDVKKILEIRSCLASLESLEGELITSIISLYLNPNPLTKSTFQFIFKNWLEEVAQLKTLIDLIIDPAAFSEVVQKRIIALLYDIKDNDSPSVSMIRSNINTALSYTKKLLKTLWKSIDNENEEVKKSVKVFIEALQLGMYIINWNQNFIQNLIKASDKPYQECRTSCSLLDQEIPVEESWRKILKRMELIIKTLNNLILSYSGSENASSFPEDDMSDNYLPRTKLDKSDIYKLNAITPDLADSTDADILTPYINRGRIKCKERTILYKTPKHEQYFERTPAVHKSRIEGTQEKFARMSFRSRCCRILPMNLELENSLDLELTELLDKATDLDNTFTREPGMGSTNVETEEIQDEAKLKTECEDSVDANIFLGTLIRRKLDESLKTLSNSSSLSIDKDSKYEFNTPERIEDLNDVQKKINFLVEQMKD